MSNFDLGSLTSTPVHKTDSVTSVDGRDVYKFTLANASDINLSLNDISGGDADLSLYQDTNGNGVLDSSDLLVDKSIKSSNQDDSLNRVASAGTYFAAVDRHAPTSSSIVNYELDLSATAKSQPSNLLPKEFQVGVLETGVLNKTVSGNISDNNTADVYAFSVSGNHHFANLTLKGLSNDADIRIIRDTNNNGIVDTGEVIAASTRTGSSTENTLQVGQGNYLAQVYQYSGNTNYQLEFEHHDIAF